MDNETYLRVSYFSAALIGVLAAVATALALSEPLRRALGGLAAPLAAVLRRALPAWLVLAALLAFLSVTYFNCEHRSYEKIVADRDHLAAVTRRHGSRMCLYLTAGLVAYGLVVAVALSAKARLGQAGKGDQPDF